MKHVFVYSLVISVWFNSSSAHVKLKSKLFSLPGAENEHAVRFDVGLWDSKGHSQIPQLILSPLSSSGTTCLVALLSDRELTVANVGDSRGVLCDKDGNAVALSHDHKPYQLKERKRIKRAGT